jgi:hypothetical protein
MYKGYWVHWKSLAARDGILERHWSTKDDIK